MRCTFRCRNEHVPFIHRGPGRRQKRRGGNHHVRLRGWRPRQQPRHPNDRRRHQGPPQLLPQFDAFSPRHCSSRSVPAAHCTACQPYPDHPMCVPCATVPWRGAWQDDYSEQLAQERDFRQEHFDFIQMHIRKFCLAHGAALIYSGKAQKTADAFYRYALHLACGLPFTQTACISETEGLFIPRGTPYA